MRRIAYLPIRFAAKKIWPIFFIFIVGCGYLIHWRRLTILDQIGKSEEEIKVYVDEQEKLFYNLCQDIGNGSLSAGMPKTEIIEKYGNPIFLKNEDAEGMGGIFFYRHPTNYYSSKRVYLYFDKFNELRKWDIYAN